MMMKLKSLFKFVLFFGCIVAFSHASQLCAAGDSVRWLKKILAEHECNEIGCKAKSISLHEEDDTLFVDYLEKMFTPEQFAHVLRVGPEDFVGQGIRQIMVGYVVSELDFIFNTIITVDSKIQVIEVNVSLLDPLFSLAEEIDSKIDNINCSGGTVGTILSFVELLDSKIDNINCSGGLVQSVDSKIDILTTVSDETLSLVEVIDSKIDNINCQGGAVSSIDSKTDILIQLSDTILSTVDALSVQSNTNLVSAIDKIETGIVALMYDFAGTWTVLDAIQESISCLSGNTITQQDVGTTGFTIHSSGEYTLCEDIFFSPSSALSAITIAANNVSLNLNNNSIQQTNGTAGVSGVLVNINLSGIVIHDGSIVGMTANGVSILSGGSNDIIDNVLMNGCGSSGLNVIGATNLMVKNAIFTNNSVNGLLVNTSNQVCIVSSVANNNGVDGFGLVGAGSRNLIDTCKAFENTGNGFNLTSISDSVIKNSIALNNGIDGISLYNSYAVEVSANSSSQNTVNGIDLRGNTGTSECYISNNTMIQNGGVNLIEQAISGLNSILGNFAQNPTFAQNYCSSLSAITTVTIRQSVPFVSSPARWDNINMIP